MDVYGKVARTVVNTVCVCVFIFIFLSGIPKI